MTMLDRALAFVLEHEGGSALSMDRNDSGNWTSGVVDRGVLKGTKYGISAAAYPQIDIAALTLEAATALYKRDYWDVVHADEFEYPLALALFDTAVNCGVSRAIRWGQEAACVTVDGVIGAKTTAIWKSTPRVTSSILLRLRLIHYASLTDRKCYWAGWFSRVIDCVREGVG